MSKQVNELYEFGPFRIDPKERLILRDGEALALTPKAFETLLVLIQNSGHLLLKDELMKTLWPDSFVEEVNLSQNISQLRRVLGDTVQASRYIVTVPGKGYRFVGEVRTLTAEVGLVPSATDAEDSLILESRSRSRIVVEEEIVEDDLERDPRTGRLAGSGTKLLPGEIAPARSRWHWMLLLAIFGTAIGGLAVWLLLAPAPAPTVLRTLRLTHTGRVSPFSRVLTDGSRIYFTETMGALWTPAFVPVGGGEPTPIASSLPSVVLQDIDRSNSKLLVAAQTPVDSSPLWVMPAAGGSAQRLGDIVAGDSAWSPDGRTIIYSAEGSIYVAGADGSGPRKLLSVPGVIERLRWSPDGQRVRFTVDNLADGARSLWEASADGGNPHPMSLGWKQFAHRWGEGEFSGDWTPDGKYFVFRSYRDAVESFWSIREKRGWFQRADSVPVQIYTSPDRLGEPKFSADGKKMFFLAYREQRELVRYDTNRKLFVPYLGGIPVRLLAFSPDGQWVTYKNDVDGTLWRSRVDGTEMLQLTFAPLFVMHSSWMPDGQTIVFQGSYPGELAKLYTIPLAGGKAEILLQDENASVAAPSVCPDGRTLLFMRRPRDGRRVQGNGVSVLDLTTHQAHVLPDTMGFDGVHCSPDGNYAAASDSINRKLMLYDFRTQRWDVLSDGNPYGWGIRWSLDSRYVYYQHAMQEEQPVFRVRISDKKIEQITSSREIVRADVLSYTMTGLTPDNSPLVSLVRRNSDVYALELNVP